MTASGRPAGLQASRDVDGVAHHRVAVAHRAGHHLAGVDPHSQREADAALGLALAVRLLHRLLHGEPGANRALGVVLVGDGRAEHAHHVVADELVDGAAVALDLLPEAAKRPIDHRLDRLGIHLLSRRGVSGEVGEDDRRLAPLLGRGLRRRGTRRRGRRASREIGPALDAELGPGRVLGATGRTCGGERCAARHAEPGSVRVLGAAARAARPLHTAEDKLAREEPWPGFFPSRQRFLPCSRRFCSLPAAEAGAERRGRPGGPERDVRPPDPERHVRPRPEDPSTEGGEDPGSFEAKLGGPFQGGGDQFPQFDVDASVKAESGSQTLSGSGGLTSTGRVGVPQLPGHRVRDRPGALRPVREHLHAAPGPERLPGAGLLGTLGISPANWLTDVTNEGTADVDGTETIHVSGKADVPALVEDLKTIARSAGGAGGNVNPDQLDRLNDTIQSADLDVYTGEEDRTLRKLDASLEAKPPRGTPGAPRLALDRHRADLRGRQPAADDSRTLRRPAAEHASRSPQALRHRPWSDRELRFAAACRAVGPCRRPGGRRPRPSESSTQQYQHLPLGGQSPQEVQRCAELLGASRAPAAERPDRPSVLDQPNLAVPARAADPRRGDRRPRGGAARRSSSSSPRSP